MVPKRPSGKFAWSPKLREVGLVTRYWHLRLRDLETNYSLCIQISALRRRLTTLGCSVVDDLTSDISIVKQRWKTSLKELRKVRTKTFDYCNVHLVTTLTHLENMKSSPAVTAKIQRIQRLVNIEKMRKPFRHIHAALTPTHGKGISKLFVPSGIKNKAIAARFANPDGTAPPAQLIAMAQSDKTSVTYDTILDCDTIEMELI